MGLKTALDWIYSNHHTTLVDVNRVLSYYHDKRTHFTERIFGTMQRNS